MTAPTADSLSGLLRRRATTAPGATQVFRAEQFVPTDPASTFAFFADATNLGAITPPSLSFRILSPLPIEMREGALIDYELKLYGAPIRWQTRIDEWLPGKAFTDIQLRGPYSQWVHRHEFVACDRGTLVLDHVEYALPLPKLSAPVHSLFVRPMIERIFAYRRAVIARVLA